MRADGRHGGGVDAARARETRQVRRVYRRVRARAGHHGALRRRVCDGQAPRPPRGADGQRARLSVHARQPAQAAVGRASVLRRRRRAQLRPGRRRGRAAHAPAGPREAPASRRALPLSHAPGPAQGRV